MPISNQSKDRKPLLKKQAAPQDTVTESVLACILLLLHVNCIEGIVVCTPVTYAAVLGDLGFIEQQ